MWIPLIWTRTSNCTFSVKSWVVEKVVATLCWSVRIAFDYAIDLFQDCVILLNKIKIELMSTFKEVNKSWRVIEGGCETKFGSVRNFIYPIEKRKHLIWFWNKWATRRVDHNAHIRLHMFWNVDVVKL